MPGRPSLALALLALLAATPGCLTSASYDHLAQADNLTVESAKPHDPIGRVTGASVALLEGRLSLVVRIHGGDGPARFFATSLQGADVEAGDQTFGPVEITALPASVAPVLFVTKGAPHGRDEWSCCVVSSDPAILLLSDSAAFATVGGRHPTRADLEHSVLVSTAVTERLVALSRTEKTYRATWQFWVSVAEQGGRRVHETEGGPVPEIEHERTATLATELHVTDRWAVVELAGFVTLLPITVPLDVAYCTTFAVGSLPFLPLILLMGGLPVHGC